MNEEFERRWERKVEFLLNQQAKFDAKFDADMEEMKKHHAEITKKTDKKLNEAAETISSLTTLVFEGFKITDARITAVAEAQRALAESQKLTDEKLRDLTALFDRHLREGHDDTVN